MKKCPDCGVKPGEERELGQINRLYVDAVWDRQKKKFVRK